jgi:hypothetical protein
MDLYNLKENTWISIKSLEYVRIGRGRLNLYREDTNRVVFLIQRF